MSTTVALASAIGLAAFVALLWICNKLADTLLDAFMEDN